MKTYALVVILAVALICSTGAFAATGVITLFDVPGATSTYATAINNAGRIAGYYVDANQATHGFTRDPLGNVSTFDAPGAGTATNQGTTAVAISNSGFIAGSYVDSGNVSHGFLRGPGGTFMLFDAPGASNTYVTAVNYDATVVGYSFDSTFTRFAYIRDSFGNFTNIAVANFVNPLAASINTAGRVAGYISSSPNGYFGLTVDPSGVASAFAVPLYPRANVVNDLNVIGGSYSPNGGTRQLFLRDHLGNLTYFNVTGNLYGAELTGLNVSSMSSGSVTGATGTHGWVRDVSGNITIFDAGTGGAGYGTYPRGLNKIGQICGTYVDNQQHGHGFIRN